MYYQSSLEKVLALDPFSKFISQQRAPIPKKPEEWVVCAREDGRRRGLWSLGSQEFCHQRG